MDTRQIKERLRASLEMHALWRNLVLVLLIGVPFTLAYGLVNGGFGKDFRLFAALVAAIMVVPVAVFCVIRTIRIYRHCDRYIFCRAKLAQPHGGPLRDTIYYTLVLENPEDGGIFLADTHAIFYTHGIMSPTIEEYTNSTVTIAYNQETGMVVVIG